MKIESITFGYQLENGADLRSLGWDPELKSDRPAYTLSVKRVGETPHWSAILLSDSTDGALVPLLTAAPEMLAALKAALSCSDRNDGEGLLAVIESFRDIVAKTEGLS